MTALQNAMAQGYLTADELAQRVDGALRARTLGELDDLTADLPGAPVATGQHAPAQPRQLRSVFGAVKRGGDWEFPQTLRLHGRFSSFELDFSETVIQHERVDIQLDVIACSVELRLPKDAGAATEELETVLASVQDHRKVLLSAGEPHFRIRGRAWFGSVELRGPRPAWLNWLRR